MPTTVSSENKNAFPNAVVAVETAVPVFIGYTEKAERNGKSFIGKPLKISGLAEYNEIFGSGFRPKFMLTAAAPSIKEGSININGTAFTLTLNQNNTSYFYNSIRLFYANGGNTCYILSVGTYAGKKDGFAINTADFTGGIENTTNVFEVLEKEYEPTIIVMPDVIALGTEAYTGIYAKALEHCNKTQCRIALFDLRKPRAQETTDGIADEFRNNTGNDFLRFGAAYYPWLKTNISQPGEVNFDNLDPSVDLAGILPEAPATALVTAFKTAGSNDSTAKKNFHESLISTSSTYKIITEAILAAINELPPCGAIAGILTMVDNSRGVWKAPANISLNMVIEPSVNISAEQQQTLNIDAVTGKSINIIRPFPGIGTLLWGARTMDGNSQDWRYINVRRTVIMIEQSIKLAVRAYIFEPNDNNTWITIKAMIDNFLFNLWKQGALTGTTSEQAFDVKIGLGVTMTATDIHEGILRITALLAVVHPAEFIEITFQQQQVS